MSVRVRQVIVPRRLRCVDLDVLAGEVGVIASADATGPDLLRAITMQIPPAVGAVFIGGELLGNVGPTAVRALGVEVVPAVLPTAATTVLDALLLTDGATTHARLAELAPFHPSVALDARLDSLDAEDTALVCVACALAGRPRVLLADSLSARAPRRYRQIVCRFRDESRACGLTVLLSEPAAHHTVLPGDASAFDRVFSAREGRVRQVRGTTIVGLA